MAQNVTTEQLQKALEQLAAAQGKSVREYIQSQGFAKEADVQARINEVLAKIDAITKIDENDGVESLAEKINAIQDLLNSEEGVVQEILDRLTKNEQAVTDLQSNVDNKFKLISDAIEALKTRVTTNETDIASLKTSVSDLNKKVNEEVAGLEEKISSVEQTVNVLTGDETVEGSVANLVKQEADRAKAAESALSKAIETAKTEAVSEAVEQAKTYTDQKVKEAIDNLDVASDQTVQDLKAKVEDIENVLNDTTDENGELQKGLISRVSDNEAKIAKEISDRQAADEQVLAQAKAYTDANTLKAEDLEIDVIVNVFVKALNGEDTTTTSNNSDSSSDSSAL